MGLENNLKSEYLDTVKRFEAGDKDINIFDVVKVIGKYFLYSLFTLNGEYFQTFWEDRLYEETRGENDRARRR